MDGLFNILKSAAKSKGVELLDSHVRPVIKSQATSELTSLRSKSTTLIPDILKKTIMSYLQATSSLAMVAPLFDQHMDTFLSTFVSGFQPILFGATEQLDTHVTDRVMEKLQQKLHLSSSQETLIDEREVHSEFWPDIVGKGWSTAIHQRLRQLNQHVVTKILEQVPTVFQQHIQSVVLDRFMNVKNGNGATSMNEERGFGISNFMTSFVQEHASSKLDGVTDQIWKQVQAPFTEGLVTLFTHFESGIMDSVKNEVAKVPGLNF